MTPRFYTFLIVFLSFTFGEAQENYNQVLESDSAYQKTYDNAKVVDSVIMSGYVTDNPSYNRKFKGDFRKKYQTDDFNYKPDKPKETGWDDLGKWLRNLFGNQDGFWAGIFIKIFGFLVLGFVLYILISYFISKDGNFLFRKNKKTISIEDEEIIENIHEIDFKEKLMNAEKNKDFRLAIRYQFLNVLKKLSDKKQIDWNTEKTNHDYLKELKSVSSKTNFAELLYIFEYVWYGEFEINEEAYLQFKKKFEANI